jgi:hypothetical protein
MRVLALILVVTLSGCEGYAPVQYSHPAYGMAFFSRDQKLCQNESLKTAQVSDPRYGVMYGQYDLENRRRLLQKMCMEEKGYVVVK